MTSTPAKTSKKPPARFAKRPQGRSPIARWLDWRGVRFWGARIVLAIPVLLGTTFVSEKLQFLSGNALWVPPEKRVFVTVVAGLFGLIGFGVGGFLAGHVKERGKAAEKITGGGLRRMLAATVLGLLAAALALAYMNFASATTQQVQTSWGDAGERDGLDTEYGDRPPPIIQKLAPGNYRIRIPREWRTEDRDFWLESAKELPGSDDQASALRRGLSARFSAAPVEVIERIQNSSAAIAELAKQDRYFVFLHLTIVVLLGAAFGALLNPAEAAFDGMMEHFVRPATL